MSIDCQAPVNILFADSKELEGKTVGQMLLELPRDERQAEKLMEWLRGHREAFEIDFKEEG